MHTRRLAEFAIQTRTTDVPSGVIAEAAHAVMDTMACALAGTLEPSAEITAQWVQFTGAREQSGVWGRNLRTSPAEAAFANGTAAHALDFDDSLPALRGHPSSTIVPAALAVAECADSSGADILAAYAVGVDISGKLGRAIGPKHYTEGWHATSTIGAFGATAAAARLWGLTVEQLEMAWGIAASQTAGMTYNFGTMTKPFHAGHAAKVAVTSAWLAKQDFTATSRIFDGKKNFLTTYGLGDGDALETLLDKLGNPWDVLASGIYVKRWPCCYCNHRPVGAIFELVEKHAIRPEEIEAVDIGFVHGSDNALQGPNPQTGLEGKFSIEYVAAATLLDGKLTLETFTDPMVQRPEARALMAKVRRYRVDDGNYYSSKHGYTDVAIKTARGEFSMRATKVSGSPEWPMSGPERIEKFTDCAGRVLGQTRAHQLMEQLTRLPVLPDVREMLSLTAPATGNASPGKATAATA
jgi:2-methylcitrate dehydratase PrpD